jgi:hypothetical protein
MRLTAEIRWFWAGAPPAAFQEWFTGAGPNWAAAGDSQTRTDEYLRDNTQCALGIKKRGGQDGVEIKGLIAPRHTALELAGCASPVDLWAKWPSSTLTIDGANLIRVRKRRWMRKFRVGSGAAIECTGSDEPRKSGCDVELTLLDVKDAAWWTFGFEAFGELDRVEGELAVTVAVLAGRNPPPLPRGETSSYPRWIASLRQ